MVNGILALQIFMSNTARCFSLSLSRGQYVFLRRRDSQTTRIMKSRSIYKHDNMDSGGMGQRHIPGHVDIWETASHGILKPLSALSAAIIQLTVQ